MKPPRVAFFTDSYYEVNGVALTSREFAAFAKRREYPFFSVHSGPETRHWSEGEFETYELAHSNSVLYLESDLQFDLRFYRHRAALREALRAFRPDLIHLTGPGHCGILGALVAHDLRVPVVASWHTNLHEFGAKRLQKLLARLPDSCVRGLSGFAESASLRLTVWFYEQARIAFAPNPELVQMLSRRTRRPVYLMERGIDTELFSPDRRTRADDGRVVIGSVGRLSPEKGVRSLVTLERALIDAGIENYQFLIVGDGAERPWLVQNLRNAELPGVQLGQTLAESYANMDVFVFPSETDTFGNVVLEAHASAVPTVVTAAGGPKFLVRDGLDGFVAADEPQFAACVLKLCGDSDLRRRMGQAARESALRRSWDAVMESVYAHYDEALASDALGRVA